MLVIGDCKNCGFDTIKFVLCEIDRVLSQLGKQSYANDAYYLNIDIDKDRLNALIIYKNILQKKLFDCNYTSFSTEQVISKAKEYIYGK